MYVPELFTLLYKRIKDMATIVKYQKFITRNITRMIEAPEDATELCTIDGWTYVSLPNGLPLPSDQPAEIADSITPVDLDPELKATISDACPHVRLIRERVRDMIADQYPVHEEIKLLRTAPSPEFEAYNTHAETCRQWGRDRKSELGL